MDDALAVTNLVYFGTLMIGGALVAFLAVATMITLIIAGAGQGIASIVMGIIRAVRRPEQPKEAPHTAYSREAIIAKADAILAAQRAAAAEKPAAGAIEKPVTAKPAAVVPHVRPATSSHRPGQHTGTQPALAVGRAS